MEQDASATYRHLRSLVETGQLNRRQLLQRAAAAGLGGRAVLALLAAGSGVAWEASTVLAQTPKRGGEISFALQTDAATLDPQVTSDPNAYTIFANIYSTLVYQDLDLSYKGLLAESWQTSPDNLSITFKLRQGITFQNGDPFTADVVKYTFNRLAQVGVKSPIYDDVKKITKIDVIDPTTVKLTFAQPSATFFHAIANAYGGMLSKAAVEKAGNNYGRQPAGTGPYSLKSWQTGSLVTLSVFPDFKAAEGYYTNRGAPYIASMAYKIIPEASSQTASLETGEIDSADLSATDLPRFEHNSNFQIFTSQVTGLTYLGINATRPLMSDLKVRQAIAHAVNRQEIVDTVFTGGLAQPVYTPLPPSIQGYNKELESLVPKFDVDQAKTLLQQAGYQAGSGGIMQKDGKPLKPVLYTTTSTTSGQVATLIQGQLRKAGIDMQIKQFEQATLLDLTPKGEHDLLLLGYEWGEPDALYLFLSSDRLKSSNRVHFQNPQFDQLLKQGQQTLDTKKRMQIYYDAQKIVIEQLPWVPLYMPLTKTAVAKRVQNVKVFPTGGLLLNDAWIK